LSAVTRNFWQPLTKRDYLSETRKLRIELDTIDIKPRFQDSQHISVSYCQEIDLPRHS